MFLKALADGLVIIAAALIYTAVFAVVIGPYMVPGEKVKAVGLAAVFGASLESPWYWLLLVAVISAVVWMFTRMFFLKALAAGFGIVVSLVVFTMVFAHLQFPKEKATSMIFLVISPYYWLFMIVLAACEAWLLMRNRAG